MCCLQGSEELFSTEPLPARTPSVESVTHVGTGSAETGAAGSLMTRPRTPLMSTALQRVSVERLDEDLVSGEPEVRHRCRITVITAAVSPSPAISSSPLPHHVTVTAAVSSSLLPYHHHRCHIILTAAVSPSPLPYQHHRCRISERSVVIRVVCAYHQ